MQVYNLHYAPTAGGWSAPFPAVDGPRTLVLVFGASDFAERAEPLRELRAAFPTSIVTGCSSSGEIQGDRVQDGSLAVAIAVFESSEVRLAGAAVGSADDSCAAGASLGAQLAADDLRGVLVFSDGLSVNGSELVRGIVGAVGEQVPVTGGLAGDGARFQRTWVLTADGPVSGHIAAVGLYGPRLRFGHGSRGGWDLFGPERLITRAEGNVLYELDGKPALALYKEYLGDRAAGLPATALLFPLAIHAAADGAEPIVRTVLGVDEATQSMTFAGDLPTGWQAQLMKANFDRLIEGAASAASLARRGERDDLVTLAVAVSCVGRRLVLAERAEEEVEAALEGLPPQTAQVGFYSYGEISPHIDGTCRLHNQTMTLTTIQED